MDTRWVRLGGKYKSGQKWTKNDKWWLRLGGKIKSEQKVDKCRKSEQKWTDAGQGFGPLQNGPIWLNRNPVLSLLGEIYCYKKTPLGTCQPSLQKLTSEKERG